MKKIGLTGGIGSGKTYVGNVLERIGYPVFNADIHAKDCMVQDDYIIHQIQLFFGHEIYKNGELQTKKLADIVFNNTDKLNQLNSLVHPLAKKRFVEWSNLKQEPIIIKETAILFETDSHLSLDAVICVVCPDEISIDRVMRRDQIDKQKVISRMNHQFPNQKKEDLADYIIFNDGNQLLLPQIVEIFKKIG